MRELNLRLSGEAERHIENGEINHPLVLEEIAGEMDALTDCDWQSDGENIIEYCTDEETLEVDTIYWSVESIVPNPNVGYTIQLDC